MTFHWKTCESGYIQRNRKINQLCQVSVFVLHTKYLPKPTSDPVHTHTADSTITIKWRFVTVNLNIVCSVDGKNDLKLQWIRFNKSEWFIEKTLPKTNDIIFHRNICYFLLNFPMLCVCDFWVFAFFLFIATDGWVLSVKE